MTLRFQRLRLRAVTSDGVYGADVTFSAGLTVLWADNTKGKSTCMQGMLYALGLERMLSPRREIPLPHAMTAYLNTNDEKRVEVLESSACSELLRWRHHALAPRGRGYQQRYRRTDLRPTSRRGEPSKSMRSAHGRHAG